MRKNSDAAVLLFGALVLTMLIELMLTVVDYRWAYVFVAQYPIAMAFGFIFCPPWRRYP